MKKIALFILVVSIFTACKKDENGDPLLKYRLKEYTHNHYKFTYEYDSLNRIVKSGTFYDGGLVYNTRYFYVNNKIDSLTTYRSNYPMTYETYKYIGDTILVISYRYSFNDKTAIQYVKRDNQIVRILTVMYSDGGIIPYPNLYRILHWVNDNLAAKYTYSTSGGQYPEYKSSEISGEPIISNSVLYEYDEHPNPFSVMNEQLCFGAYESSKNNLLRMIVADTQGDTLYRIFKHTYNENGLPIATTETQEKNNTWINENLPLESSTSSYKYEEYK